MLIQINLKRNNLKQEMSLYVGERDKDVIDVFSKFNFKRVEEVGLWSYFVNGKNMPKSVYLEQRI